MLEYIRNNVAGIFGFAIIAILAFVFTVSFGQQNKGWGKTSDNSTIITVDGNKINSATLNYATSINTNREMKADSPEYAALRQQVAEGLVERSLLISLAKKMNITASKDEAMESIIKGEYYITRPIEALNSQIGFQMMYGGVDSSIIANILIGEGHKANLGRFVDKDGKFDATSFNKTIRYRLNFKEDAFIEEQRLELIAKRVRAVLLSGITVAPSVVRDEYNRDNNKVSLSYIRISGSELKDSLDMSKEAVAKWTSENSEAIKQYYETNKYKYTNVEKSAHARHILIKVAKDADETAKAEAKMKITTLLQRVKAGEDFAELARQNSEDEGSAKKGGDLGYNPKGVMVPAFDDAMFALAPGQISDVVETEFGYHIIKLEDFREGTVSLEDATAEIAEKLYKDKGSETLAKNLSDEINKLVKAGKTLEEIVELSKNTSSPADEITPAEGENETAEPAPAAPALELPKGVELSVQTTAPFGKNAPVVPGIGKSQELLDDAFTLTKKSEMLKKIYSIDGNFFAVALNEHKTPTDEGFAAESEKIKDGLLAKKMMTVLKDKIMALREKAMADGKIESDIALASVEPKKSAPVKPVKPAEAAKKPAKNK